MDSDVVDLILTDHRRFRELFEQLQDPAQDRSRTVAELSSLLVAHAEAEETDVYPILRRLVEVDRDEVDHGSEEHLDGHRKLLDLLLTGPSASDWNEKLDALERSIRHHLDEEESTILAEAREALTESRAVELGQAFADARRKRMDEGCGRAEYVRNLIDRRAGEG